LLATGWTGPLRVRSGSARDFLIGIRVALHDGRRASAGGRVGKNVSGYDLMKLHYGALGTLGVIVAASFKVFPKALHDVTGQSTQESVDQAWAAAEQALTMPMAPAALELFSTGRGLARFLGSPEATKRTVLDLGWAEADGSVWAEHSKAAPALWARIAAPRHQVRTILHDLGVDKQWWASPGTGIHYWAFADGFDERRLVASVGMVY